MNNYAAWSVNHFETIISSAALLYFDSSTDDSSFTWRFSFSCSIWKMKLSFQFDGWSVAILASCLECVQVSNNNNKVLPVSVLQLWSKWLPEYQVDYWAHPFHLWRFYFGNCVRSRFRTSTVSPLHILRYTKPFNHTEGDSLKVSMFGRCYNLCAAICQSWV